MAFKPGKDAWLMVDAIAGTGVNLTGYTDQMSLDQPIDTHEVSVFGTNAKAFIPGLADGGSFNMSGPYDVALGTTLGALHDGQAAGSASSTIVYAPAGSVSGQIKQTAEGYLTSYSVTSVVGGRVEYSASFQITGAVTNGTW
jgi:hypothetical protein